MIVLKDERERSEEPRAQLVYPMDDGVLIYVQV